MKLLHRLSVDVTSKIWSSCGILDICSTMEDRKCPGLPSKTICDNEGKVQITTNGTRKNKTGNVVQKYKYQQYCPKHRREVRSSSYKRKKGTRSGLRAEPSRVVKLQAKRIRDLEQKYSSAQQDLHDYSARSHKLRRGQRLLTQKHDSTVNSMEKDHRQEVLAITKARDDLSQDLERLSRRNELHESRMQRHVKAIADVKAKLRHSYKITREALQQQALLEGRLEEQERELEKLVQPSIRQRHSKVICCCSVNLCNCNT